MIVGVTTPFPSQQPTPVPPSQLVQPEMIVVQPTELSNEVLEAGREWERRERSSLFVLVCTMGSSVPLRKDFVDSIYRARRQFENLDRMDVLLDHYGGDIEAAYQLIGFFRRRCRTLRIFVPDFAKSAATLLTLGADELWMSDTAEIGPLDAQIPDPRDPDRYISALDEFRAVDYLQTHSFEILNEFSKMLSRTTSLSTKDRLHLASQYTTQLMAPLYSNVDPIHFGASHRSVDMSIEYGKRVMSRYAYRNWSQKRITDVLRKLAWDYPSHSFVIDFFEALELGLHAKMLDGELNDMAHEILDGLIAAAGFLGRHPQTGEVEISRSGVESGG